MSRGGCTPSAGSAHASPVGVGDAPVVPDYAGDWLGALLPTLLAGRAPGGAPAWVARARQHVVLLIDGLGWEQYRRFGDALPALAPFTASPITAVVPSTTATALPSLATGVPPATHGMLGDKMRVGGRVLNVLRWTVPSGAPPDPAEVQPVQPFPGGRVAVVSGEAFIGSGFSAAHLRGAPYDGYAAPDQLVARVLDRVRAGTPLVYAYFPDLDRTAHERGFEHDAFGAALAMADAIVGALHAALPSDVALLVTADHGHVTTDPAERVDLAPLGPMVSAMAGSARFRYLHARPGAVGDLRAAATELVGDRAWVLDRAGLLAAGWLGPAMRPVVAGRLGDVILAARGTATMVDPADLRQAALVTMHGSVTAAEVMIPLLAAPGAGPSGTG